jgi:Pyridoxamine 5'-phosphate oxidase
MTTLQEGPTAMTPRDRKQRTEDTLAKLAEPAADVWVSTASPGGEPYLVPLSLAWIDERAVIAVESTSRTARNLEAGRTARLAVGPTRDVVVIDATLERSVPVTEAPDLAERYVRQADWDPRVGGETQRFLVLRPERIQAWREADELAGRTLMRDGTWLS